MKKLAQLERGSIAIAFFFLALSVACGAIVGGSIYLKNYTSLFNKPQQTAAKTSSPVVNNDNINPAFAADAKLLTREEIITLVTSEATASPNLSATPSERQIKKQAVNPDSQQVSFRGVSFSSPWPNLLGTSGLEGTKANFQFSQDRSISIIQQVSNQLMNTADLSASQEVFSEKYNNAAGVEMNLALEALKMNPELVLSSKDVPEINTKYRLLMIKKMVINLSTVPVILNKRDDGLVVITGGSNQASLLQLQNGNSFYKISLRAPTITQEDIDAVISTLEVK